MEDQLAVPDDIAAYRLALEAEREVLQQYRSAAHAETNREVRRLLNKLAMDEQRHVEELEKKFQLVRDYTAGVATGRTTGYYLYGDGGCGKSHTLLGELERLRVPYKLYNSRMTGRGLYNALERFPDAIHVLEDMEQLFRDSGARGVLRSALLSQSQSHDDGPLERLVTWTTYKMEHSFVFIGQAVSLRPLRVAGLASSKKAALL